MTINEFIEKYKSDNFDSYIKENATIDYWNELIKTYKLEKLNFASNVSLAITVNPEMLENQDLFFGVRFDGFCERQIKKLEIEKQYKPQQTVFDLTIENLLKNGCNEQEANELFNTTGSCTYRWNIGNFYVSKLENKFYTGIDYQRKVNFNNGSLSFPVNCPDLIPEYYNLALFEFLHNQKNSLGLLYNEANQTEKFISNEIKRSKDIIDNAKESFLKRTQHKFESKELLVNVYESYIYFLEQPQQTEAVISDVNFQFENNFDRVKNTAVYDFFKTKLVDKKYLTVNNLHSYLKVAFENQQPPQTKFSFEKKYLIKDIRKIFYNYFTEINTEKYSTQDRYIKLLTDYFEGFNFEKIKNNFNK